MLRYPVTLRRDDNGTIMVEFPDVPEAHTFGETEEDALAHGADALLTALDAYIADKRPLPAPSQGKWWVDIPPIDAAKIALYKAMLAKKVTKYRLSQLLGWHTPQVDRVLTLRYRSRFDQVQQALEAVGLRAVISVEPTKKAALHRVGYDLPPINRSRSRVRISDRRGAGDAEKT